MNRRLEANIASAEGRIAILESSMDRWSKLSAAEVRKRVESIRILRVNIQEWRRLAESEERIAQS